MASTGETVKFKVSIPKVKTSVPLEQIKKAVRTVSENRGAKKSK